MLVLRRYVSLTLFSCEINRFPSVIPIRRMGSYTITALKRWSVQEKQMPGRLYDLLRRNQTKDP